MSTGQASFNLTASSRSPATWSSTSTAMNVPSALMRGSCRSMPGICRSCRAPLRDLGADQPGDVLDPLGHGDARLGEARDLLRGGVLLAFDDRAGVRSE